LTGHFTQAFVLAAVMSFLGLVGWLGMVPKIEAIDWGAREKMAQARRLDLGNTRSDL
jgi:hypothetical protein